MARVARPLVVAIFIALGGLPLGIARVARAAPNEPSHVDAAKLFDEARELMQAGRYAEACPKLEDSQRMDPAGGTVLNLALCYEKTGRLATAWATFHDALDVALRDRNAERVDAARERMQSLEQRVSRLTIAVPVAAQVPGLGITRNGIAVGHGTWNDAVFVDGGEHVIEVSAPGRATWRRTVQIAAERDVRSIAVPVLEAVAAVAAPAPHRPMAAYVVGGAGIVAVGVGTYFGISAIGKRHDVERACPDLHACTASGKSLNDQALVAADVSTIAIGVGLAALAVGVYLYVRTPTASAPVTVGVRAHLGGMSAVVRW